MIPDPDPTPEDASDHHELGAGPISLTLLPDSAQIGGDGRLAIAGVDIVGLATEYGTPVFIYDEDHIRRRCREAVVAWGDGVAYASKAFLCKAMARLAHEEGMCIDVSTAGELAVAVAAGVPAGRLVQHGNNKSNGELASAVDKGVGRIVIDSFDEIARLERIAGHLTERRNRPKVLIRVTPGIE